MNRFEKFDPSLRVGWLDETARFQKAWRVAISSFDPHEAYVYGGYTDVRLDYADHTLAWCGSQREYEAECLNALGVLRHLREEATV